MVSEATLKDLVAEAQANDTAFRQRVRTVLRSSYSAHYRRMLPMLLAALEFRCNNTAYRPVMDALDLLRRYTDVRPDRFYDEGEKVPIEGVVPREWADAVVDEEGRVERIPYELCVLRSLREALRRREVCVAGAARWRDPEVDLPADFEANRDVHYAAIRQPLDPTAFVDDLRGRLGAALDPSGLGHRRRHHRRGEDHHPAGRALDQRAPTPGCPEPANLVPSRPRWSGAGAASTCSTSSRRPTSSPASPTSSPPSPPGRSPTEPSCAGACCWSSSPSAPTPASATSPAGKGRVEAMLRHVRRHFVTRDNLRRAVTRLVNATFAVRDAALWGKGTACASDSKKFGSWSSNFMTEWHARYGGAGVMIYWHVERKSLCIYSQLTSCSASEVAAMMEGVLRHFTSADIDRNYVDTHGPRWSGFAFCSPPRLPAPAPPQEHRRRPPLRTGRHRRPAVGSGSAR